MEKTLSVNQIFEEYFSLKDKICDVLHTLAVERGIIVSCSDKISVVDFFPDVEDNIKVKYKHSGDKESVIWIPYAVLDDEVAKNKFVEEQKRYQARECAKSDPEWKEYVRLVAKFKGLYGYIQY